MNDALAQRLVERIRHLSRPLEPRPTGLPAKLARLEGIRAVLFDIYGTLLISASGDIGAGIVENDERAFRRAFAGAGLPAERLDAGTQGAELLAQAIRQAHAERRRLGVDYPEVDIVALWEQVLERLPRQALSGDVDPEQLCTLAVEYECRTNPVWPMPGLELTLARLREKGLPLGIVSNAQFYTPLVLQAFLGATPAELGFAPRLCAWSYRLLEAKPSIALFQPVLEELQTQCGVAANEVLYVGNDRLKDIWPAARLGCRTALFAGDQRSLRLRPQDSRCGSLEPDLVITDLRQLEMI